VSYTTIHLYTEEDALAFECSDDEPTLWIRSMRKKVNVSIGLNDASRANLRAALDAADKIANGE
jgi:hypothetical protein